jgi:hypothetical protein
MLHRTLERQLKKYHIDPETISSEFLQTISDTYAHFDDDRSLIERSLELVSQEMTEKNNILKKSTETLNKAQEIAKIGNWEWDIVNDKISWSDELYKIFLLDKNNQSIELQESLAFYKEQHIEYVAFTDILKKIGFPKGCWNKK